MGIGWELTRGLFGASAAAGRGIANAAAQNAAIRRANRGSRAAQRGLIGPFDDVPAGAQNFLDYSGVATPPDIRPVKWAFPLGRYVLPKGRSFGGGWTGREEIGISTATANRHTAVYAPTQSGKTTSIIAPWIYAGLAQGYFVVTLDLKGNGDLLRKVQEYTATKSSLPGVTIAQFDYTRPNNSVSWNWIRELSDDALIEAAALALAGKDRDNDPNREFRLRDLKWLRGLLEFAHSSDHAWTVQSLLRLLDDQTRLARYIANSAPQRARSRLSDLIYLPYDEYYNKVQFVVTYLEVLNNEGFNRATARRGLSMADAATDPGLLVVSAPLADGRLSEAVSGLFLSQFVSNQLKKFNTSARPVLLVLDEAPRLQTRLQLPEIMATAASSGMSILLALQDIRDFQVEEERETILSNCATHILMPGAGAPTTEYFGKRLGTRVAARQVANFNYGHDGRGFQSGSQTVDLPVLGRNEMADPPGGAFPALVHSYDLSTKPILVDLTRCDLPAV